MTAVSKAVERCLAQIAAGNSYEAQQMFKTVYHRYRTRKQVQEAYQVLQVRAPAACMHGPR
jgi:hypothetical protein